MGDIERELLNLVKEFVITELGTIATNLDKKFIDPISNLLSKFILYMKLIKRKREGCFNKILEYIDENSINFESFLKNFYKLENYINDFLKEGLRLG